MSQKSNFSIFIKSFVFCVAIILFALLFTTQRQRIFDQVSFWQYKPTSQVVSLYERSGMNEKGKFYFYASKPKIDATQTFNDVCSRVEHTTSILGCYDGVYIYIYDVKNEKLDGIMEVTAVHETLHAIYQRLSTAEKDRINKLLEIEYEKLKGDKEFVELISFYDRTEPGQRYNELHSIIGTGISNIDPELENYYKQYFIDRNIIINLDMKYSSVFRGLKTKADELSEKLNSLSDSITSQTNEYNSKTVILNNDISDFNNRAASGVFNSMSQFYNERYQLSVRVSDLDSIREKINYDIKVYSSILEEYNSIALESKKLYNSIDSTLAPAPSV